MPSLANLIYLVGQKLLDIGIKRALSGVGLGLATYAGISELLDKLISDANASLASGDGKILSIIGLTGIDVALSLILSACVIRATITSSSVFLQKID